MTDDDLAEDIRVEWNDFLTKFHENHSIAQQSMKKVDLFPTKNKVCFVLYKAFLPEECEFLINSMEEIGFHKLSYGKNYRTNLRTQIHQEKLAEEFLLRVRHFLPERWPGENNTSHWELLNVNERIRICKYEPGQFFAPHFDGIFKRSFEEQSKLTIMAYLNDSFTGGNTNFLDENVQTHPIIYPLKPETGMILIFEHEMFHEGEQIHQGLKYIMRSDVVYRRFLVAPMSDEEKQARDLIARAEKYEDQGLVDEAVKCYRKAYRLWPQLEKECGK